MEKNRQGWWDRPAADLVASAAICSVDVNAQEQSLPRWNQSAPLYEACLRYVIGLKGAHLMVPELQRRLRDSEAVELFLSFRAVLLESGRSREIESLARRVRESARLLYSLTSSVREPEAIGTTDTTKKTPVRVVIPFRDDSESQSRFANLLRSLALLREQEIEGEWSILVIEGDSVARHREHLQEGSLDYLHLPHSGPFNKSLLLNAGVEALEDKTVVVLADADVAFSQSDVSSFREHFARQGSFVPGDVGLFLSATSSESYSPRDTSRAPFGAYALRDPRGLCVVTSAELYRSIGGFDERFSGWGGEDRDFHLRLSSATSVWRMNADILHLNHDRPDMKSYAARVSPDMSA